MKTSFKVIRFITGMILITLLLFTIGTADALTVGETYSITMSKVNSDGTTTDVDTTSAVADANGKIAFSFSSVPTFPDTFFLVLTVKDSLDAVQRRSFTPAPPVGGTGELGANSLSTIQANMILQALALAGTDDPIVVAYGLILTRSDNLDNTDIGNVAILGKTAIMSGFESFLTNNGVSASTLTLFKQKLIYNQPNKDLSNFTTLFKSAVDNPGQSSNDMAKAAGLIADIFIDAALAADIDLGLLIGAHDGAGEVVDSNQDAQNAFAAFGADHQSMIEQAMGNFFMRIAAIKVKSSYSDASGTQIDTFNTEVATMMTTMENLDKQYSQYYDDPSQMTQQIKTAMDTAYENAFNTFQTAIASSNGDIITMKSNIATALGMQVADLPGDLGTYRDFNGDPVNWAIPQVVAFNWVAQIIAASGNLAYDRATVIASLSVPGNMNWLNGNGTRSVFTGGPEPASFSALMGMQEDMMIAEHTRWNAFSQGQPTRAQEKAAELAYKTNKDLIKTSLSGTTDGSTAITAAQKKALILMMEQPSLF